MHGFFFHRRESHHRVLYPCGYGFACALLESQAEGAVAAVTAFAGQLLGDDGLSGSGELLVAADEMVDAQIVDIDIIRDTLTREILAEILAVGANGLSQLLKAQVLLQVELCVHAAFFQQLLDLGEVDSDESLTPAPSPSGEGSR